MCTILRAAKKIKNGTFVQGRQCSIFKGYNAVCYNVVQAQGMTLIVPDEDITTVPHTKKKTKGQLQSNSVPLLQVMRITT